MDYQSSYSPQELAKLLDKDPSVIYSALNANPQRIPGFKLGGCWVIPGPLVQEFMRTARWPKEQPELTPDGILEIAREGGQEVLRGLRDMIDQALVSEAPSKSKYKIVGR